jgi:hypothetical protein
MGVIKLDQYEKQEVKFEFRGKVYNVANDLKTALKIMNEFSQEQAKEGAVQDIDAEMAKVDEVIKVAISNYDPELLELTCEKQTDKKVAVLSDQISAVIVSQKSGAASTGRAPGFVALATE